MAIRVLSICYNPQLMHARHVALRQVGCSVDSVLGTVGAKNLERVDYDVVVIGHAAPLAEREELLRWVRRKIPLARVVALRSGVADDDLASADVNAEDLSPDGCVRAVLACLSPDYRSFAV